MAFSNLFKKNKYPLGLLKDPWDGRDFQLLSIQPEMVKLSESFDLREKMSPIGRQRYGSCTSWGSTAVKEYLDNQEYHKTINLSEKFVYHFTKVESGLWNTQGDYIRSALKAICKYGAPLLEDYPDTPEKNWETYVKKEPSAEICEKAKKYKGGSYWSVGKTLESFRQAVFQQTAPIDLGMGWYSGYYKIKSDGKLPLPSGKRYGGHCVCNCGWENEKLWFRNSWGSGFGNQGYFYIPFNEFTKHDIWNAWILTDFMPPKPIEGWCAERYLKEISPRFHQGDIITPITNLNLREKPTTNSKKITLMKPGQKLEVLEGNVVGGQYKWWKIKIKL